MTEIQKVRTAFGLSIDALAQLLDVSVPQIKMAGTGKRKLPPKAHQFLQCLFQEAQKMDSHPPLPPVVIPDQEDLLRTLKKKKRKIAMKLEKHREKQAQMQDLLKVSQVFMAQFPIEQFPSPSLRMQALALQAQAYLQSIDLELESQLILMQIGIQAQIDYLEKQV